MIVNGQRNKVVLDIVNKEKTAYTVFAVSGQVSKVDDYSKIVRNVSIEIKCLCASVRVYVRAWLNKSMFS